MKEKFKIMKTPPQVTEAEIDAFMDFDRLLKRKINAEAKRRRQLKNLLISGGGCMIIAAGLLFLLPPEEKQPSLLTDTSSLPSSAATIPSLGADTLIKDHKEARDVSKQYELPKTEVKKHKPDPVITEESKLPDSSLRTVYVQAEPVDGYPALYQYFADNLVYPVSALKDSIEGVVNVVFVIGPSGKATEITVENSLGTELDREAIRLVETMPLWRSAMYNDKPVRTRISLPITFSIHKTAVRP